MNTTPLKHYTLIMLLAILLVCGLCVAISSTLAQIAQHSYQSWKRLGVTPDIESWEKTNNLIRFARFVNPYSPSLIDIQYQIVYSKLTLFPQQEDSLIQQLESLNRESIKQRPLWPYTWANLAHIKAYKNEYDELFNEGIQKALHLGPKLSNIQLSILELSIKSWSHLNSATQDIIISQLGTQSYEGKLNQKIVAIIKAQGFLPILCAGIRSPLKAQDLCT